MKIEILVENENFLVINKPAGVLSQKDQSKEPCVSDLLSQERGGAFLHPVHRLDRNTSGILVLAKSSSAAKTLSLGIQGNLWKKTYLALVKGNPGERGRIDLPLKKDESKNLSKVDPKGEPAVTEFQRIDFNGSMSLVKIDLLTGRSHQIRVHFSHLGHALIGDRKYGKKPWSELAGRPLLHAHELEFEFSGKPYKIHCPIPKDFRDFLDKVGNFQKPKTY